MTSETNKILESLLKQQGISEFLPFEKPEHSKIKAQLYGYCKNDKFHVCDASLKEYELQKVLLNKNGTFLVGKDEDRFFLTDNPTCECIVISNDNRILIKNPDCYTKTQSQSSSYLSRTGKHQNRKLQRCTLRPPAYSANIIKIRINNECHSH